jgi:Spy/CpxP family protein refolding chaperone
MFGFIFGTLCLIALFAALRRRRYARYGMARYGCGPGHGRGYGYGYAYAPVPHRRGGRWLATRWLFEHLDTTPGQEKAIRKTLDELRERLVSGRDELQTARKEVAQAVGGDVLDETALKAASDRVEGLFDKTRSELGQALLEVHAALDGPQRKALAEMIADGFPRYRRGLMYC